MASRFNLKAESFEKIVESLQCYVCKAVPAEFTYYDHVKPLDEKWDDIIAGQSGFVIGNKVVEKLSDENNKLPIEITIHALKEEAKDTDMESGVSADESE